MKYFLLVLFVLCSLSIYGEIIEDFEADNIEFSSYPEFDEEPNDWALDTEITYPNSSQSLHLWGNTWKVLEIEDRTLNENSVWSSKINITEYGQVQGIGFQDSLNILLYSIDGTLEMDTQTWVADYQGAFPQNEWNNILFPIAADWLARFDYLPTINSIVFLNENTYYSDIYFDDLEDVTDQINFIPDFEITYRIISSNTDRNNVTRAEAMFTATFTEPVEDVEYFWQFGDGETSTEISPTHRFVVHDNHQYNVVLQITNNQARKKYGACTMEVNQGSSTLPLSMCFVGDIMMTRGIGNIINQHDEDPGYIYQHVSSTIQNCDIAVANIENPLTDSNTQHPTKGICFKADPSTISTVTAAGWDVVSIANNHIYDFLDEGIQDTRDILTENNILFSGAGSNSYEANLPAVLNKQGVTFSFLASSDRTGQYNNYRPYLQAAYNKAGFAYMTPFYVDREIQKAKDYSDHIIVELHAGSEYSDGPLEDYDKSEIPEDDNYQPRIDTPHMWDREIRHYFIDQGADLIIVHHPHRIHGIEVYDGKVIAHSLGNFIFDLSYAETFPSMILHADAYKENLKNFTIEPVYIDDNMTKIAKGELGTHILDYIAQKSRELGTYINVQKDERFAEIILDTLTMDLSSYRFVLDDLDFDNDGNFYISQPLKLPRNGNISAINNVYPTSMYWARLGRDDLWNGNMEDEGSTLWDISSNGISYDENEVFRGEQSMKQSSSSGSLSSALEKKLLMKPETDYTLCGNIKTINRTVNMTAKMYSTRNANNPIQTASIPEVSNTEIWKFYYENFTSADNAKYVNIFLESELISYPNIDNWFDDVSLIEWTDWIPLSELEEIEFPNDYYFIQLKSVSNAENCMISGTETMVSEYQEPVANNNNSVELPKVKLANYPNPFNPTTTIKFSATENLINPKISIYNIKGQLIKTINSTQNIIFSGEEGTIIWDGENKQNKPVSSGVYFYKLEAKDFSSKSRKLLLLK